MANITPNVVNRGDVVIATWTPVTENDTCLPVVLPRHTDRSVQAYGTFGAGGNVQIQGSNDIGSSPNFIALTDAGGTAIGLGSAGISEVLPATYQYRGAVSAGTSVSVTIKLFARKS